MKGIFSYAKHIEKDYVHPHPAYQSKIQLALSSVATEDYEKAKGLFDQAILQDARYPSAWLGKAFVELYLVKDEKFNDFKLDEYLKRATVQGNKLPEKYHIAFTACMAFKHSTIMNGNILLCEKYLDAMEAAKIKKKVAATTAVVGGLVLSGQNKSTTKKVIGGTMLAGGGASAVKNHKTEEYYSDMADKTYDIALKQLYRSVPIIKKCNIDLSRTNDQSLKIHINLALNFWKKAVDYLYDVEKDLLLSLLDTIELDKAEKVETFVNKAKDYEEVRSFLRFMNAAGLSEHRSVIALNKLIEEDCPRIFGSSAAKYSIARAKRKQHKGRQVGIAICSVGLLVVYLLDGTEGYEIWPLLIDTAGILIARRMIKKAQSTEMLEFHDCFNQSYNQILKSKLDLEEINLNLVNNGDRFKLGKRLLAGK